MGATSYLVSQNARMFPQPLPYLLATLKSLRQRNHHKNRRSTHNRQTNAKTIGIYQLYASLTYIFLYFFFCSLLATLLLEKVLSRVAIAKINKHHAPPNPNKKLGERLGWLDIYFHATWSIKYSTYLF